MSLEVLDGVVSQFDSKSFEGTVSVADRRYQFDRSCVKRGVSLQTGTQVTILVSRNNLLEVRAEASQLDTRKLLRPK